MLAAGTLLSRLTGFIRIALVAALLFGDLSDAYNFANGVPNTVYDLLLGGVLSATLIPVFVEELHKDDGGNGDGGIAAVLGVVTAALVVLSALLYVAAPLVVHFYLLLTHSGHLKTDELAVGTSLLRYFAPQVFFLGAIVVSTAMLNARRRFAAAAFSPIVNNLIAIAALAVTAAIARSVSIGAFRHDRGGLLVLGLGTTLGYLVQFAVQLPAMRRAGLPLRPIWAPRHPAVRKVISLSAWLIGVVVANQVSYNLIVLLSERRRGDFTVYQTAYQFFQLPYALFAVSIASAIMPDLAERWAERDHIAFLRRVILGVRSIFALLLPAAIGFALVAQPAIDLAVRHGVVNGDDAHRIGLTVAAFAFGLPGFSVFLPLVRALQAMTRTRTMFAVYALENGLTVALAVPLFDRFGVPGLAIAWSAPYTVASIAVAVYLRRKVGPLGGVYTARSLVRTVVATLAMAVVVFGLSRILPSGSSDPILALRLVVEVGAGASVFLWLGQVFGIAELNVVLRPLASMARRVGVGRVPPARRG